MRNIKRKVGAYLGLIGMGAVGLSTAVEMSKKVAAMDNGTVVSTGVDANKKQVPKPVSQSVTDKIIQQLQPMHGGFETVGHPENPMFFAKRQKRKGWQKQGNLYRTYRKKKCVKGGRR